MRSMTSTAWSLPLAFDVTCLHDGDRASIASEPFAKRAGAGNHRRQAAADRLHPRRRRRRPCCRRWLSGLPRGCACMSSRSRRRSTAWPSRAGRCCCASADNPESLHDAVAGAVKSHGLTVHAVDTAFVDEGAGLGGPNVHWVRPPRVVLMVDRPASHSCRPCVACVRSGLALSR